VSDRDILEHIIYDFDDPEMMEMVRCVILTLKTELCFLQYVDLLHSALISIHFLLVLLHVH